MSEYIHEIVLQEFVINNIKELNLIVNYKNMSQEKIIDARFNKTGTFWDLEGKLESGIWIPVEVEWITHNFYTHKHDKNQNFKRFLSESGILLVLRKNKDTPMQQLSIFENFTEAQFKKRFKEWFNLRSGDFVERTLKDFMVGNFKRDVPRVILYPLSKYASKNYFNDKTLYRKYESNPNIIGFKDTAYKNNAFIRDLQKDDICLFIEADGKRCKRIDFINKIKMNDLNLFRLAGYRILNKLKAKNELHIDDLYWTDEIKNKELIYPHVCCITDKPFVERTNIKIPFVEDYSEDTWEAFRSCIQYGEYREISPFDFTLLISNL